MNTQPWHEPSWSTESSLIRPYSLTGGRTRPSRKDLTMTAQVMAVPAMESGELDEELELILSVCAHPISVAEVASRTGLVLGVLRVLLSDLVDQGRVVVHSSGWDHQRPDMRMLRSVLDGIRRL